MSNRTRMPLPGKCPQIAKNTQTGRERPVMRLGVKQNKIYLCFQTNNCQ